MSDTAIIETKGLRKSYSTRKRRKTTTVEAVRGLDLTVAEGEIFGFLGPNGAGKTTTMRMIAGFEEPTRGSVFLRDVDVTDVAPNKRDVNMVFQSYALFPHMSVFENVAFGLKRKKVSGSETGPVAR